MNVRTAVTKQYPTDQAWRLRRWVWSALLLLVTLIATATPAVAVDPQRVVPATLVIANRDIVVFRATLLGYAPLIREERARDRVAAMDPAELGQPTRVYEVKIGELDGRSVYIGDVRIFTLVAADLDPEDKVTLDHYAESARIKLSEAVAAKLEQRRLPVLLSALAHTAGATLLIALVAWGLRRLGNKVRGVLIQRRDAISTAVSGREKHWHEYLFSVLIQLLLLFRLVLIVVLGYGWLTYVLEHFPVTKPLGRALIRYIGNLADWLVTGLVDALPGIVTIAVILVIARALIDALARFFESVQKGRTDIRFLHRETVPATRRIVTGLVWIFALAIAYPFIPGSGSEAFKGLSVLVGVMISLGSTGLINQLMGGLVIVYSRALRRGDFVVINEVEGTVLEVGTLATKVATMRGEEITIPNAVLINASIRNYSKNAGALGSMLSTKVTIGYDTPWRQVHAMLLEAARRTQGLRSDPRPFVLQRALTDFYPEYELLAYTDRPAQRVGILSDLHANIQDVFNEQGVQIMSPHFVLQPRNPVVAPPERSPEGGGASSGPEMP